MVIDDISYELELSNDLAFLLLGFNVSLWKRCVVDLTSFLPLYGLTIKEELTYKEVTFNILY